jgi:hypothetical protein
VYGPSIFNPKRLYFVIEHSFIVMKEVLFFYCYDVYRSSDNLSSGKNMAKKIMNITLLCIKSSGLLHIFYICSFRFCEPTIVVQIQLCKDGVYKKMSVQHLFRQ